MSLLINIEISCDGKLEQVLPTRDRRASSGSNNSERGDATPHRDIPSFVFRHLKPGSVTLAGKVNFVFCGSTPAGVLRALISVVLVGYEAASFANCIL